MMIYRIDIQALRGRDVQFRRTLKGTMALREPHEAWGGHVRIYRGRTKRFLGDRFGYCIGEEIYRTPAEQVA